MNDLPVCEKNKLKTLEATVHKFSDMKRVDYMDMSKILNLENKGATCAL